MNEGRRKYEKLLQRVADLTEGVKNTSSIDQPGITGIYSQADDLVSVVYRFVSQECCHIPVNDLRQITPRQMDIELTSSLDILNHELLGLKERSELPAEVTT